MRLSAGGQPDSLLPDFLPDGQNKIGGLYLPQDFMGIPVGGNGVGCLAWLREPVFADAFCMPQKREIGAALAVSFSFLSCQHVAGVSIAGFSHNVYIG
ncbi:MAG: hypothetical protein NC112_02590 [Oxalobacter formigenes]|nr:hypothetical protein [Oxalobacter formigenes]